jgi:hypothetical protein
LTAVKSPNFLTMLRTSMAFINSRRPEGLHYDYTFCATTVVVQTFRSAVTEQA